MPDYATLKESFLQALVEKVEIEGWGQQIIEEVCLELDLDKKHYHIWFPQGTKEILDFLENKYDQEMLEIIKDPNQQQGVTNKIAYALKLRICDISRSKMLSIKNSLLIKFGNMPGINQ
jgi:ubiquinone biosynthesis protein COQ9